MSTYNPYGAINAIYNLKGAWDKANGEGDSAKKKEAAKKAQEFYAQLRSNGYSDVADTLTQSNTTQAKYISDYYKRLQEVAEPRDTATAIQEENDRLFASYRREYEDLKSTNPFDTPEGKAILAKYDLAGLQGRDNQAAIGASTNGGNIDSYSAAHALRQQAALVNQGQEMVLSAHQQKLDHVKGLLLDMGINIDRVFNQQETAKQNDFAIEAEKANISGYTPSSWTQGSTNVFLNADGTLKSEYLTEEFDNTGGFSSIIAAAEKAGNTELLRQAKEARAKKILGNYVKYGQYDDGNYTLSTPQRTAEYDLTKQQIESAERIAKSGNDTSLALAEQEAQNSLDQIEANTKAQKEILGESAKYGVTTEGNALEGDGTPVATTAETEWDEFISRFNDVKVTEFLTFYLKPYYERGDQIDEEVIERLVAGDNVKKSNSTTYDLDTEEVKAICSALGLDYSWVDEKYTNRWGANGEKGMKLK